MDQDKINYEMIEFVLEWIVEGSHDYPREGSVLVSLHIQNCVQITTKRTVWRGCAVWLLILNGDVFQFFLQL